MYKITLPTPFTGERYGVRFEKGIGETKNKWLASHLRDAGHFVESAGGHNGENEIQAEEEIPKPSPKTKK